MKRYRVTLKRIGLTLVWLANVATVLVGTYIIVHHTGVK
jgi:hypothetical protein